MSDEDAGFGKDFVARVGPKADVTDSRKNCQLNLKLEYDPGFSYSVYQADYTGWADLDPGVTGNIKASYYFSGDADSVSSSLCSTFQKYVANIQSTGFLSTLHRRTIPRQIRQAG